jgi:hypothetical protein
MLESSESQNSSLQSPKVRRQCPNEEDPLDVDEPEDKTDEGVEA